MNNKIRIKWRGQCKYYATEIPLKYRRADERRTELMARSREELEEKYEEEIAARKQGLDRNGGRITLSEFLTAKYLPFCRNEVEIQSWNDYRLHIETNIVPLIGQITLARLGTREVDDWMTTLRQRNSERTGRPLSERTVDYSLSVLRRALQFAVDWRYIASNPASARVRMAKRRRRIRPSKIQFLTPAHANVLLSAVRNEDQEALYTLALTTGMRADLRFHIPDVALWHACLAHRQPQCYFPVVHVLANRPLRDLALGQLVLHPRPDPVRRVPLFTRHFPVGFQDRIDELDCRLSFHRGRSGFFRGLGSALPIASRTIRRCTLSFLATPTIVPIPNSYSRRICANNSTLALQSNESPPFGQRPNQSTRSLDGGPKQTAELSQIRIPKSLAAFLNCSSHAPILIGTRAQALKTSLDMARKSACARIVVIEKY